MEKPTRSKLGRPSKGIRKATIARMKLADHRLIAAAAKARKMGLGEFLVASAKVVAQEQIQLPVEQTTK